MCEKTLNVKEEEEENLAVRNHQTLVSLHGRQQALGISQGSAV